MRRKDHTTLISAFTTTLLFTTLSLYIFRNFFSSVKLHLPPATFQSSNLNNFLIHEHHYSLTRHVSSIKSSPADSVLLPDWELLLVSPPGDSFLYTTCLFPNNLTSPAKFAGVLQFSKRLTFKCVLPNSVRRRRPLLSPLLTKLGESTESESESELQTPEMIRWSFLVYESLSTEDDVIVFAKGVNRRAGMKNRSPEELRCVFTNGVNYSVKTSVLTSSQEVFRCEHPNEKMIRNLLGEGYEKIKISIEIGGEKGVIVPSVTYYTPQLKVESHEETKSLLCACTMVHNVAKFLKEWVVYHSNLGVERFILYDNDSDDDLEKVVKELVNEDFNVNTFSWPWPKTQEAGFSHSAVFAKDSCTWMMYMDVDEFVFSPSWLNSSNPSHEMLLSFLPNETTSISSTPSEEEELEGVSRPIGQVSIRCQEYGPSNQESHPKAGVTQGYTCRRRVEQRHKSIVQLEVIDKSLRNAIHHFQLKDGYRMNTLSLEQGVVNHYKYQAWSEFRNKFKRRVSAYVVDWTQQVNPSSQDRTPGLGFEPIEPEGWASKFCEVNDSRLKMATQKWFSLDSTNGSKLIWQD